MGHGYDEMIHTICEFSGCYWHDCPACFSQWNKQRHRLLGLVMEDTYQITLDLSCTLEALEVLHSNHVAVLLNALQTNLPRFAFVDDLKLPPPVKRRRKFT